MLIAILILLATWGIMIILPWWALVLPMLAGGALSSSRNKAYLMGIFIPFSVWVAKALILHIPNKGIMAQTIAAMLGLPSSILVIIITGIFAALLGTSASLAGFHGRQWLMRREEQPSPQET